jgi:copper transport protein
LPASPSQVVLHFGEPVEIDFGSIQVIGPSGGRVDEGGTHHPPGDNNSVATSLPSRLPDGTYVVAWRVISADSHPVHGAFVFSVGSASGAGKAHALATSLANARGDPVVGVIFWFVRFLAFTSLVVLVGLAAMVSLLWPAGARTRRIRRMLWGSWGALLICSVAGVSVQGVYAGSLPVPDLLRPSLFNEVLKTRFGEVELLRILLLLAAVPVLLGLQPSGPTRTSTRRAVVGSGAVIGLGLLLTPGLAGHASTGGSPAIGMVLDFSHLAAVSVWLGGLALLAATLLPGLRPPLGRGETWSLAARFSPFAFLAVIVVVISGVIQAIREVGSFYALFNTTYGVTLLIKIGFVVVLVAIGSVSRRLVLGSWLGPRLSGRRAHSRVGARAPAMAATGAPLRAAVTDTVDLDVGCACETTARGARGHAETGGEQQTEEPDQAAPGLPHGGGSHPTVPGSIGQAGRGVVASVCAEFAIALVVLAVTALLVNTPPAKQAANVPFSQSFSVLGVQVNAIVAPAKAGPGNQVHFYVLGPSGQPTAIPELDAAITLRSEGIGPLPIPLEVASPGHFRATDVDIPYAGNWTLKVTVRTSAIDEQEIYTTLPIR